MKLRLVIGFDSEVRRWSASFPELPGIACAGDTEEAQAAGVSLRTSGTRPGTEVICDEPSLPTLRLHGLMTTDVLLRNQMLDSKLGQ